MLSRRSGKLLLGLVILLSGIIVASQVPMIQAWISGLSAMPSARLVLGQPNFTSEADPDLSLGRPNAQIDQSGMYAPCGVAVDPVSGAIFVSDTGNSRILRFDNPTALRNGADAVGVLGQPDFTSRYGGTTRHKLFYPQGITVDDVGALWVADSLNGRVLRFDHAASKPNGAPADGVLGQPDFITHDTEDHLPHTPHKMAKPMDVAVDADGRLWVVDWRYNRVLRFDNAAAKPNGAPADGVLGHSDFTGRCTGSNCLDITARRMSLPVAVAVDVAGHLWVTEYGNHRVLRFDDAAAKPNGAPADGVLGQLGFASCVAATTRYGMNNPAGIAVDGAGILWVADAYNHRVLRFDDAAAKPNGASADSVLGQSDFTSRVTAKSRQGMNYPQDVAVDNTGHLWVADSAWDRVLMFDVPQR